MPELPHDHATPCVACGYDLRGVRIGDGCPECGTAVGETLRAQRALTRRQAVAIALRLAALYLVLNHLVLVDFVVWLIVSVSGVFPGFSIGVGGDEWLYFVIQAIPTAMRLGFAVALWVGAGRIAGWVVKRDGAVFADGRSGPKSLLSVGLILLGVYVLLNGLTSLARHGLDGWLDQRGLDPFFTPHDALSPAAALAWVGVGATLIGSVRVRDWLGRDLRR